MKLYEYMGKKLFDEYGIPVPKGKVAKTPDEVEKITTEIGETVIKAQILSGKRGKAGGIKFTADPTEAKEFAKTLLGSQLLGMPVDALLVEEKLKIDKEYYVAITIDGEKRCPVVLASTYGGMDIEDVPEEHMVRYHIDYKVGMMPFISREITRLMGLAEPEDRQVRKVLEILYKMFVELDAELLEINPLVVSNDKIIAADAKVTIDDEALYRHPELPYVEERTASEKKAHDMGLSYVELNGDIGVMANGAGITMATLDTIQHYGGAAANFLDAGGGAGEEATAQALGLILERNPKAILINIFGGITRCDDVANAFISVKNRTEIPVPVVIRLVGTNQEEGRQILKEAGIETFKTMHEAA
ncbi:MAG TPA: ADP-forming succinate--CoA ligase subunit beta, partial [Anaerovoracaceae bacterium]|nr:ADP-forming succinate--CoA ligase subunit beta [Anaerovoracaceae bacterium]